jgi:hypothetical protein
VNPQRRGLGIIFIVFGLLSCALMAAAALYAQNRVRVFISAAAWRQMYLAHFFCTTGCGAGYLWLGWRQTGKVPGQEALELAVGICLYVVAFMAAAMLLVSRRVGPWCALAPGLCMLYYGSVLVRGKTIFAGLQRFKGPL